MKKRKEKIERYCKIRIISNHTNRYPMNTVIHVACATPLSVHRYTYKNRHPMNISTHCTCTIIGV